METTRVDGVKAPQHLKTLMKRLLLDLITEPLLPIFFPGLRDLRATFKLRNVFLAHDHVGALLFW